MKQYKVIESVPGHRGVKVSEPRLTDQQAKELSTRQLVLVLLIDASGNVRRIQ